ncbi:MAG: hypothetical protein PHT69_07970 [Bacteroidales bacterium]|nr:hypothetical protein [Bacteroidales bacterium]
MHPKLKFLIIVLLIAFAFVYLKRVNYYEPVSLSFSEIDEIVFDSLSLYGTSPINRPLYIDKNAGAQIFSTLGNHSYIRHIYFKIPNSFFYDFSPFELQIGDEHISVVNKQVFLQYFKYEEKSQAYLLSFRKEGFNLIPKLKAISHWPKELKRLISLFSIFIALSILIYIFLTSKHFERVRNKTQFIVSFMRSKTITLLSKKLFFVITLIITLILLCFFVVAVYWGIYCGFVGYLFLLLIFCLLFQITFILSLFLRKNMVENIRLSLFSLFLVLFIFEFFLRYFDINASYLERNNLCYERIYNRVRDTRYYKRSPLMDVSYKTSEFTYFRKIYESGFVQPYPDSVKKENEYRILALGDSFTEGVGVALDSCWVSLLENKLQASFPDKDIYTFNAGASSSDPIFQHILLKEIFSAYNFDLVIVNINESDIYDIILRGGYERFKSDGKVRYRPYPRWEFLYSLSYIFRLVIINGLDYNHFLMKQDEFLQKKDESVNILFKALCNFKNFTNEHNQELLIVFQPTISEVLNNKYANFRGLFRRLKNSFEDIQIVDLYTFFIKELKLNHNNIYDYYWKIDGHYKGKGYNAHANKLHEYIIKNDIIK